VNHADLTLQFQQSASLRLLQARNAPLALSVLFSAFKREHLPSINESRLRAILEAELGELTDAGELIVGKPAKDYLVEGPTSLMGTCGGINQMEKTNRFTN
jgi:hypothetical protein